MYLNTQSKENLVSTIVRIISLVINNNYVKIFLAVLAITSINFAAYISYFDMNILSLVDATALSRHIFRLVILYTVITYSFHLFYIYLEQHYSTLSPMLGDSKFPRIGKIINKIITKMIPRLRMIPPVITFLFFYVGFEGLKNFIVLLVFCMIFMFSLGILRKFALSRVNKNSENELNELNEVSGAANSTIEETFLGRVTYPFNQFKTMSFYLEKSWIFLILAALVVGGLRANFVEKNILASVNSNDVNSPLYSIIMTTSSGVGLYSSEKKQVKFISWDNINNINYSVDSRRSYQKFFKSPKATLSDAIGIKTD